MARTVDWMLAHLLDRLGPEYDPGTQTVSISLHTGSVPPTRAATMRVEPDLEEYVAALSTARDGLERFVAALESVDWSRLDFRMDWVGDAPDTTPRMPPTGVGDPLAGVLRNIDQVLEEE